MLFNHGALHEYRSDNIDQIGAVGVPTASILAIDTFTAEYNQCAMLAIFVLSITAIKFCSLVCLNSTCAWRIENFKDAAVE